MPKSLPYHDFLISHLKDASYAAGYIEAILEEEDPEPELLKMALSNVAEALGEQIMTAEQAKVHLQKLDELLSKRGSEAIYNLSNWLNALGLKLTVAVDQETKDSLTNFSINDSEVKVS
jgi:DNA-binding phage protein